jgi:hypothetical protein
MPFFAKHKPYLDVLKHFEDCDVYVGINYGFRIKKPRVRRKPLKERLKDAELWKQELLKTGLNVNIIDVPASLEATSDASAYQQALKLYRQEGKKYRYCYFMHTKGITRRNKSIMWLHRFIRNSHSNIMSPFNL